MISCRLSSLRISGRDWLDAGGAQTRVTSGKLCTGRSPATTPFRNSLEFICVKSVYKDKSVEDRFSQTSGWKSRNNANYVGFPC